VVSGDAEGEMIRFPISGKVSFQTKMKQKGKQVKQKICKLTGGEVARSQKLEEKPAPKPSKNVRGEFIAKYSVQKKKPREEEIKEERVRSIHPNATKGGGHLCPCRRRNPGTQTRELIATHPVVIFPRLTLGKKYGGEGGRKEDRSQSLWVKTVKTPAQRRNDR